MTLGQPVSNLGLGKPNKERAWPIVKFLLSMQYNRNFEEFLAHNVRPFGRSKLVYELSIFIILA